MKKNQTKRITLLLLCFMLIAALAFGTVACGNNAGNDPVATETPEEQAERTVKGEGSKSFNFDVVDKDGNTTKFLIHTDKEKVGDALWELELIAGSDDFGTGLYVKTVNGITADYDVDKTYWAFYINDSYAMTGVEATKIVEGATYAFKVESM